MKWSITGLLGTRPYLELSSACFSRVAIFNLCAQNEVFRFKIMHWKLAIRKTRHLQFTTKNQMQKLKAKTDFRTLVRSMQVSCKKY